MSSELRIQESFSAWGTMVRGDPTPISSVALTKKDSGSSDVKARGGPLSHQVQSLTIASSGSMAIPQFWMSTPRAHSLSIYKKEKGNLIVGVQGQMGSLNSTLRL